MNCGAFFGGGGCLDWYQLQQRREKPWQLMCWWGRWYWPRRTDSYWQNGENTCQRAPSEGVFKDFGGLSNVPVVLPAGRGSLAVTDREAVYRRSANTAKRCQVLLLLFDLSQQQAGLERDKTHWPDMPNMEQLFSCCCCLQYWETDVDCSRKRDVSTVCCAVGKQSCTVMQSKFRGLF